MAVNFPPNIGKLIKSLNLNNIFIKHPKPLPIPQLDFGKEIKNKKEIDWNEIALTDPAVSSLLAAGFTWHTNWGDPEKSLNPAKAKKELDIFLKKLTEEYGPGGVSVIKSAYYMSDIGIRSLQDTLSIWVCDVEPAEIEVKEEPQIEKSPVGETNGRRFFF